MNKRGGGRHILMRLMNNELNMAKIKLFKVSSRRVINIGRALETNRWK